MSESENEDEDGEVKNGEESENADRRIQRILTKSRLVHDIDSTINVQNYDRFDIPETEKKVIGIIKHKNSTEKFILPTIHRLS